MCNLNIPLQCSECAFNITISHLSSGNLGNCIKCFILENKSLKILFDYIVSNIQIFQSNKEFNTVLSNICSHKNEEEILNFLPVIKTCNYRFDKWYLHYAILNNKEKVIQYLIHNGCTLRQNHLQSAIQTENLELINEILKKFEMNLGEKIQKSIPEWLLSIKNNKIIKLCMPYCSYICNTKHLITAATNKNYYLLYQLLQKYGLHLNTITSSKILDVCNSNLISNLGNIQYKGIQYDIDYIGKEEKSKWFRECVEWCEMSSCKRYFKFLDERNKIILGFLEDKICKDVTNLVIGYL
jgi:hypothetical protein